jgi:hypothetical protein
LILGGRKLELNFIDWLLSLTWSSPKVTGSTTAEPTASGADNQIHGWNTCPPKARKAAAATRREAKEREVMPPTPGTRRRVVGKAWNRLLRLMLDISWYEIALRSPSPFLDSLESFELFIF